MTSSSTANLGLRIAGVSHRFGAIVAAADVDLEVRPGEVHGLVGPSGSGKSTLLRLVAGLEVLQQGAISIDGRTVAAKGIHLPPEARSVGFVFQDYALFPHLDARRNIAFGMTGGRAGERRRAADQWLERVGLAGYAEAMPHTLSGGQQQRVALARALARKPTVMLLDEPFSGLDEQLRGEVRAATLALLRDTEVATLLITHDPHEALVGGDTVSVIRGGHLLQTGNPDEVYRRPSSFEVAQVFGPCNRLSARARDGEVASPWGQLETGAVGDADILVRPDGLVLSRDVELLGGGAAAGRIVDVVNAGSWLAVTVEVGEAVFEARDLARQGWRPGEVVSVSLAPGAAHIVSAPPADAS